MSFVNWCLDKTIPYTFCFVAKLGFISADSRTLRKTSTPRNYRVADKFLARPGRKQATATEDFEFHITYL